MNTAVTERQAEVTRLTKTAVEAAQQGRWDQVIQCYNDRGLLLASMQGMAIETNELLKMDEHIRECAHTAQALLGVLLSEASVTKQRLQGLRHRLSGAYAFPESVSMEA